MNYTRTTRINWKLNPSWFETQNEKVLVKETMRIGSSTSAVKAMTSREELLRTVMPTVIGASANTASVNWQKEMNEYFNSISVEIPKGGFILNLSMDFNIDDPDPIRAAYIRTLKDEQKITTSEQLMNYIVKEMMKGNIKDDSLYKFGQFENPAHYILYIYCLGYKAVANNPKDVHKSAAIKFYIFSDSDEERRKEEAEKRSLEATKKFTSLIVKDQDVDTYMAIYIELFPNLVRDAIKMPISSLQAGIIKVISNKEDEIIKILNDLDHYIDKSLILKYEALNLIKRLPPSIFVDPENPSFIFGENLDQAISFFHSKDENKIKVANALKQSYLQLKNHK